MFIVHRTNSFLATVCLCVCKRVFTLADIKLQVQSWRNAPESRFVNREGLWLLVSGHWDVHMHGLDRLWILWVCTHEIFIPLLCQVLATIERNIQLNNTYCGRFMSWETWTLLCIREVTRWRQLKPHIEQRKKNECFSLCTFGYLCRQFLIKNNSWLHVSCAAYVFDVLYRVKLSGCPCGRTGFPENQPDFCKETLGNKQLPSELGLLSGNFNNFSSHTSLRTIQFYVVYAWFHFCMTLYHFNEEHSLSKVQ